MPIQSLVFNRRYWSASGAERWAKRHGFHTDYGIDNDKASVIRIRQRPPPPSPLARYYTTTVWSRETNKPVQIVVYEFDSPDVSAYKEVYNFPFSSETGRLHAPRRKTGRVIPKLPPEVAPPPPLTGVASLDSLHRAGMGGAVVSLPFRSFSGATKIPPLIDYYIDGMTGSRPFTESKPGSTSLGTFLRS